MYIWYAAVVAQLYDTDVNKAYIIRGNSAVLKCEIPSFVADFVHVVSWHTDQEEHFYPGENYGWSPSSSNLDVRNQSNPIIPVHLCPFISLWNSYFN